jgi:hypothetical protein
MVDQSLYSAITKAGLIEESMAGSLAKIIGFYLGEDSGLSAEDLQAIRGGLDELSRDTEKHRRLLEEIRMLSGGGSSDQ